MSVALKQLGLEKDVWLHTLENEWVKLVGNTIAKHARPGRYENGMLIVFVDSSVWLNELKRYGKKEMLSKLQERFGARKMRKLVLSPDPDGP
jgi:predicted nucleic acid-binding Zn ribbon protein